MIIRKISTAVQSQDWATVTVEFIVVVAGIFAGLQVDDWNQARKNRVDEGEFLNRLHDDVLVADALSQRLRQRRLDRWDWTLNASDVLFGRNDRNTLTDDECSATVWISAFNITASGLPSVDELIGTGRMGIIRNAELRTALVALRQTRAALDTAISEKTASSNFNFLPAAFPELFQLTAYVDDIRDEIRTKNECDLAAMRANQAFLNQFSANFDGYDAYIRDGVRPWSSQFDKVHELVDSALEIDHHDELSE